MSESTRILVLFILIVILMIAISIGASNFLMRRAIKKVIKVLRDREALTPETARSVEELGFKKNVFLNLKIWRDYKPAALNLLISASVVLPTDDGRIFLSEENLLKTRFGQQEQYRK